MTATLVNTVMTRGKYNNYLIGGNICNAFALGSLGSNDDFFLIGAEPAGESNYPLLTGNILDSEGNLLFQLVRNMLVINPGKCSKILGDHIGYEIRDGNGELIFRTSTTFQKLPRIAHECFVTTITANCYDKNGKLVFKAHSGDANEHLESSVKSAFGIRRGFDFVQGFSDDDKKLAHIMLSTGGKIHRILTGTITDKEISLDGAALINVKFVNCKLHIASGDFIVMSPIEMVDTRLSLYGAAQNVHNFVSAAAAGEQSPH
jgi:hypothetical protein